MEKTIISRVKSKRDSHENWTANNPVLLFGEIITVDMTNGDVRHKTGDGVTPYIDLAFDDQAITEAIEQLNERINEKVGISATHDGVCTVTISGLSHSYSDNTLTIGG